jgi:hypothetical protein
MAKELTAMMGIAAQLGSALICRVDLCAILRDILSAACDR